MTFSIHLSETTDEDIRQAILVPLRAFNQSMSGSNAYRGLAIELHDAQGATIGGLWGATSYGWLFVQLLVVPKSLRGQGVGKQLISMAETEAQCRGCRGSWLETLEFQARAFYEKLGYACFGQLESHPPGFDRFFMRKSIGTGAPQ